MRLNIPGINGSLGECVLCGDTFLQEILLYQTVPMINIDGFSKNLPVHQKCLKILENNGPNWKTLPNGPLRQEFAKGESECPTSKSVNTPVPQV